MKLGTNVRNWGSHSEVDMILECARAADRSGIDTIWVNDHLVVPTEMRAELLPDPHSGRVLEPHATASQLGLLPQRSLPVRVSRPGIRDCGLRASFPGDQGRSRLSSKPLGVSGLR